jgi:hypothetical protein
MSTTATVDEAVAALKAQAFTERKGCSYCDHECETRRIVHTLRGQTGADWDLDAAVRCVEQAVALRWTQNFMEHDLAATEADGATVYFHVSKPSLDNIPGKA